MAANETQPDDFTYHNGSLVSEKGDTMESVIRDTREFMQKIKKTETYRIYAIVKKELASEPALQIQVDEFRKNSFMIQTGHNYGYFNSYEQMVNLKSEHDELLSKPLVKRYMDAEFRLTQMMSQVFSCMTDDLEFDIEFLE